ncbi:major facilitator superfamily domain-containing protein [Mycena galopus ATCC 62051]|nr:major facilitator superfamily domain-containing protein [Mycena galopus ATCC 62051]
MPDSTNLCEKAGSNENIDQTVATMQVLSDGQIVWKDDYTPSDYASVLRKVDRFLLPLMWLCYGDLPARTSVSMYLQSSGIQQSDKASLGNQAIFGLRTDTGLKGQEYQWLTTIFYLTYLSRTLSIYMLGWGICVIAIAAAQNWTHLMVIRGLQGFFECTISPGFILVIGAWYRTEEHAARALFWQSANAGFGIISDLSTYGIGLHAQQHPGGLAPWRRISLFLGATTIVCGIACLFLLGTPKEVHWLNQEDKNIACVVAAAFQP